MPFKSPPKVCQPHKHGCKPASEATINRSTSRRSLGLTNEQTTLLHLSTYSTTGQMLASRELNLFQHPSNSFRRLLLVLRLCHPSPLAKDRHSLCFHLSQLGNRRLTRQDVSLGLLLSFFLSLYSVERCNWITVGE